MIPKKVKFLKRTQKCRTISISSTKKLERKATIKTNSPNKTVFAAFSIGKNHPLYICVTFIYSLLWLVSILWEIWKTPLYRKHYTLRKKIDSFKNSTSLEVVPNLSILPVSYEIASGAVLVQLIIFKRYYFFKLWSLTCENEETKFSDLDI